MKYNKILIFSCLSLFVGCLNNDKEDFNAFISFLRENLTKKKINTDIDKYDLASIEKNFKVLGKGMWGTTFRLSTDGKSIFKPKREYCLKIIKMNNNNNKLLDDTKNTIEGTLPKGTSTTEQTIKETETPPLVSKRIDMTETDNDNTKIAEEISVYELLKKGINCGKGMEPKPINGINKIYDTLISDDKIYVIIEFCHGKSLEKAIKDGDYKTKDKKSVDYGKILDDFCYIAKAVSNLHSAGFVHMDLKTDNIIVSDEIGDSVLNDGNSILNTNETISNNNKLNDEENENLNEIFLIEEKKKDYVEIKDVNGNPIKQYNIKNIKVIDLGSAFKLDGNSTLTTTKGAIRNFSYNLAKHYIDSVDKESKKKIKINEISQKKETNKNELNAMYKSYDVWCLGLILYQMLFGEELFGFYSFKNTKNFFTSRFSRLSEMKINYIKNVLKDRESFDLRKNKNFTQLNTKNDKIGNILLGLLQKEDKNRTNLETLINQLDDLKKNNKNY